MVTFTTSNVIVELSPNSGYKEVVVASPSTVTGSGDILQITLTDYGISEDGLLTVDGYVQTTEASVVAVEDPTTAVASGVLSITSSTGTGRKYYRILGKSN